MISKPRPLGAAMSSAATVRSGELLAGEWNRREHRGRVR
jgi:hypothetical protein